MVTAQGVLWGRGLPDSPPNLTLLQFSFIIQTVPGTNLHLLEKRRQQEELFKWLCPKPLPGLVTESQPLQLWNKTGPSDVLAAFSNLFPICLFLWCYHIQESTKSRHKLVKAKARLPPPLCSDVFSTFYCCVSGKEVIQEWILRTWYPLFSTRLMSSQWSLLALFSLSAQTR